MNRQWFKSHPGLNCSETPRSLAFCNLTQQPDATKITIIRPLTDDRFKNNPLVTGYPSIRFYAGAPLMVNKEKNLSIGSFCIIDTKERTSFDERERKLMEQFAASVIQLMISRTRYINLANIHCRNLFSVISHMIKNPMHILLNAAELADIKVEKQRNETYTDELSPNKILNENKQKQEDSVINEIGKQGESMWSMVKNLVGLHPTLTHDTLPQTDNMEESAVISLKPLVADFVKFFTDLLYRYRLSFAPIQIDHHLDPSLISVKLQLKKAAFANLIHECLIMAVNKAYAEEQDNIKLVLEPSTVDKDILICSLYFKAKPSLDVSPKIRAALLHLDRTGDVGIESNVANPRLWFRFRLSVFKDIEKKRKHEEIALRVSINPSRSYENLIVVACDDEPLIRTLLKRMLLRCGIQEINVFVFTDGDEVLSFLTSCRDKGQRLPDVGCFDIVMQRVCGDKCLSMMRKEGFNFPVIAATGCDNTQELLCNGFVQVVTKPYKWVNLKQAIDRIFKIPITEI